MGSKQIRIGQLIAPFGPGSIYTDRRGVPHVVAGLDHWFSRWDQTLGRMLPCTDRSEFERFEPRLSALLRVDRFCSPPDFRYATHGETPPPNWGLHVPALRFPRWYRHTRTAQMRRFNLDSGRIPKPEGGGRWQPVRFISVCGAGHLCEFPWKDWIGCSCAGDENLYLTDRGGSELSSIKVECRACPAGSAGRRGRTLSGTTIRPDPENNEPSALQKAGIGCPGDRPWLGEGAAEPSCTEALVGALINQTNIYFPRTLSAITLPDLALEDEEIAKLRTEIEKEAGILGVAKTLWNMPKREASVALIQVELSKRGVTADSDQLTTALESLFSPESASIPDDAPTPLGPETELSRFRRAEFNIIRNQVDDPELVPDLRVIATTPSEDLAPWIARVNLVERLRETRAFYGFDRLEQGTDPLQSMPDSAMQQLFRTPPTQPQDRWLPAVDIYGEGIYVELREDHLTDWQDRNAAWLASRLDDAFIARLGAVHQTLPPLAAADRAWASRYLLVHSLAHVLINQFVFECGYSTASLRERLYVSVDAAAPMAAFLIYTAAGDSEGTLGGLVRLGNPERLGPAVRRALSRASWCSADPVCSENLGGQGSRLANLAACHACILLPETCCETINQGLDRSMIVGTPTERERGYMAALLSEAYSLE